MDHPEEEMTEGQRIAIEHERLGALLKLSAPQLRKKLEASRTRVPSAFTALLRAVEEHGLLVATLRRRNEMRGDESGERIDVGDWTFKVVGALRQRLAHVWQARPNEFDSLAKMLCLR